MLMDSNDSPVRRSTLAVAILSHAFVLWFLCAAVVGVGMATMPEAVAMLVVAVASPAIAALVSASYFRRYGYTTPLYTALAFAAFVVFMDFLVALLVLRSLAMFNSFVGTWLPYCLIGVATYITGTVIRRR